MLKKKNIVFILADQLRADFCGCYGADWLNTPNIDKLAEEGVLYCNAVSPSPICVPARASLLTGKSALENRVLDNSKWLRPDHEKMGILTWPQILAKEGYHTAAIGKMHFYPWDIREGFQHRVIAEDKRHIEIQDDYSIFLQKHGYKRLHGSEHEGYYEHLGAIVSKIPDEYQIDKFVKDQTCEYINCLCGKQPFALMVGFPGPHGPYDPTLEMLDKLPEGPMPESIKGTEDTEMFRPRNIDENALPWNGVDITNFTEEQKQKIRRHYSALVQSIDEYVGDIIQSLKDKGLYEDTVIIMSSDHGDYLGDFGMVGKGHFYESSIRIPLIVRCKEQKHMEVDHAVSLTDLHNTILHFAGIKTKDTVDSTVLKPFGQSNSRADIFGCTDMGWMLRGSRYILTIYYNGVREFYDLEKDPFQQNNLINAPNYQKIIEEMKDELFSRVFNGINKGNSDNIARFNNMRTIGGPDGFNYEGWQRPYPFCIPDVSHKA